MNIENISGGLLLAGSLAFQYSQESSQVNLFPTSSPKAMFKSNLKSAIAPRDGIMKVRIGWNVAGVGLETYTQIDLGDGQTLSLPEGCVQIADYFEAVSSFDLSKMPRERIQIGVLPDTAVCSAVDVYVRVDLGGQPIIDWTMEYSCDRWMALPVLSVSPSANGWVISNDAPKRTLKERLLARLGF